MGSHQDGFPIEGTYLGRDRRLAYDILASWE
jgi:hypothetical protein